MNKDWLVELLGAEVLPTAGCTEPGAVALAAATAAKALGKRAERIKVTVNGNVYKNGIAVGVPGTGETGFEIAAALGAIKADPTKELAILSEVSQVELADARLMLAAGAVTVDVDRSKAYLWIRVRVEAGEDSAEALLEHRHNHLSTLRHNGVLLRSQEEDAVRSDYRLPLRAQGVTIEAMIKLVEETEIERLEFLNDGARMNRQAAAVGLANRSGMGVGAALADLVAEGVLGDDPVNYAKCLTAAAADARMAGEAVKIMSSAGSGNHGITVIVPVCAVAERIGASPERLVRALAISHVITVYVKTFTGSLSALCGCTVAAATGASAAIAWLRGNDMTIIKAAMKNVIGNLTGMICDGGKVGCALKLATAAGTAVESALIAEKGVVVPSTNGIMEDGIEETIRNLGLVSMPGMVETDRVILDVMLESRKR